MSRDVEILDTEALRLYVDRCLETCENIKHTLEDVRERGDGRVYLVAVFAQCILDNCNKFGMPTKKGEIV